MLFIFSTPELIRHLWQLKTIVFLHKYLICSVPLGGGARLLWAKPCYKRQRNNNDDISMTNTNNIKMSLFQVRILYRRYVSGNCLTLLKCTELCMALSVSLYVCESLSLSLCLSLSLVLPDFTLALKSIRRKTGK
jgi:hypothetical protein